MFNKKEEPKMLNKIFHKDTENTVTWADRIDLWVQNIFHKLKAFLYTVGLEFMIHGLLMSGVVNVIIGWKKVKLTAIYCAAKFISFFFPSFAFFGHSSRYWAQLLSKGAWFTIGKLTLFAVLFSPIFFLSWRRYNKRNTEADELNRDLHLRGKQIKEPAHVLEDMIAEGIPGTLPIGCTVESYDDPNIIKEIEPSVFTLAYYRQLRVQESREQFIHWLKGTKPKRKKPKKIGEPYVNTFESFYEHFYEKSIKLPRMAETEGVLIVGAPGTGKGQIFNPMSFIAANWEKYGPKREDGSPALPARNIYLCDKGDEYFCTLYNPEKDILLNFCDVRGEMYLWNFIDEKELVLITDAEAIAESMIPPLDIPGADEIWRDAPRCIFMGLILWCVKNNKRTLADLYIVFCADSVTIQKYINETEGAESAKRYLEEPTGKLCQSVMSCLAKEVKCLSLINSNATKQFNIDEWLESEDGGSVFLQFPESLKPVLKGYYTVFIDTLARKILSKESNLKRRMFMFLDEFSGLNKCPAIIKMLQKGRSKGCCIFIGLQSLSQMRQTWGEEGMSLLIGGCGTKVIFNLGENFSSEYFEKFYGKADTMKTNLGYTVKVEDEQDAKQVSLRAEDKFVMPSGLLTDLPRFHAILMLRSIKRGHDVTLVQFPIVSLPNKPDVPMLILREDLYLKNKYNLKSVYETSDDFEKETQLKELAIEFDTVDSTEQQPIPETNAEKQDYRDMNDDFPDTVTADDDKHGKSDSLGGWGLGR
jgi:hypothetical protein